MGYQQGRICYPTEADATNALMTQVVPTIDKEGVLHHPVFNGKTWEYQGQIVKPTFPECDPLEYTKAGQEFGAMTVAVMASVFAVRAIKSVIETLGTPKE